MFLFNVVPKYSDKGLMQTTNQALPVANSLFAYMKKFHIYCQSMCRSSRLELLSAISLLEIYIHFFCIIFKHDCMRFFFSIYPTFNASNLTCGYGDIF